MLEQLYALVNERYEAERSIVVTTNLDQARARAADRQAHRLAAGRDCGDPLPLFGEDLRYRVG